MSVEIPSEYSSVVQRLIADGKFRNEEEIVAEGLRLIVLRETLDEDVQAGLDDLDAGNCVEASQVYAEARRRIKAVETEAAQFVEGLVASGQYGSADEAVADGVRLLMSRQQLRAEIQKGIDELDAGQGIEGKQVFAELRDRAKKLTEQAD